MSEFTGNAIALNANNRDRYDAEALSHWTRLPVRVANLLWIAGFDSPREAYNRGEDWLRENVEYFGRGSWIKLCQALGVRP